MSFFKGKQQNIKSFGKHELYRETEGINFVQIRKEIKGISWRVSNRQTVRRTQWPSALNVHRQKDLKTSACLPEQKTHDILLFHSKEQIFHGTDCLEETVSPSSEVFRNKLDKYQSGLISAHLILPWMIGLIKWPREVYRLLHFHDSLPSDFS